MSDLLYAVLFVVNLVVIGDVIAKLRGTVERLLWIIAVVMLPFVGAGFWYYVQYEAPRRKRAKRPLRLRRSATREERVTGAEAEYRGRPPG